MGTKTSIGLNNSPASCHKLSLEIKEAKMLSFIVSMQILLFRTSGEMFYCFTGHHTGACKPWKMRFIVENSKLYAYNEVRFMKNK